MLLFSFVVLFRMFDVWDRHKKGDRPLRVVKQHRKPTKQSSYLGWRKAVACIYSVSGREMNFPTKRAQKMPEVFRAELIRLFRESPDAVDIANVGRIL